MALGKPHLLDYIDLQVALADNDQVIFRNGSFDPTGRTSKPFQKSSQYNISFLLQARRVWTVISELVL